MPSEQNIRDRLWTQELLFHLIPCHQLWPLWCTSKTDVADPGHPRRKFIPNTFQLRTGLRSRTLGILPWRPQAYSPYSWPLSHHRHRNYKQIKRAGCDPKSLFHQTVANRHWKHMLHLQTRELSLLNDITAGQEEFSSGGQKSPSRLISWIHSCFLLFIV